MSTVVAEDTRVIGKAVRRTEAERSALARMDDAAVADGADYWRANAPEPYADLVDAEPVHGGSRNEHAAGPLKAAKSAWQFFKSSRVYRSVADGVTLAKAAVRGSVEQVADRAAEQMRAVGDALLGGEVSLPEWQGRMETLIKRSHAGTGLIGGGGRHATGPGEKEAVEDRVKAQFGYLEDFAAEIESGLMDGTIPSRSAMYGQAGVGTYERSRRAGDVGDARMLYERRILHSEVPCAECTEYAARGWQDALTLPDVGEDCSCKSQCRCTFERSFTDPRVKKAHMRGPALEYLLSRPLLCTPEAAAAAAAVVGRESDAQALSAHKGTPVEGTKGVTRRDGVAVVEITGPIFRYANVMTDLCGGCTVEDTARDLRAAAEDPSVKAVLLHVDSPGGEAAGIGELADQIRAAGSSKPVCAYVGNQGCSAAYWLASAATEVVAAESAMLGSIGVVMGMKVQGDKAGTKSYEFVSSQSPNKRPDPATEAGRAEIMRTVDGLADVFIAAVARNRGVTPEAVRSDFGKGGVLLGRQAVDAGMADAVGDFESTLARLARGERLPARPEQKRPKPGKAAANTPKGHPMAGNAFARLFKLAHKADPEAAADALMNEDGEASDGFAPYATLKSPEPPAVDVEKVKADLQAKYEAEAKAAATATVTSFFASQAETFCASLVEAGKLNPADKFALSARYVDAAVADHAGPIAFKDAAGKDVTATRLSFLTASAEKAPKARWTEDVVSTDRGAVAGKFGNGSVLAPHASEDADADSDRRLAEMKAALGYK